MKTYNNRIASFLLCSLLVGIAGCTLVGDKNNKVANEVYSAGNIDPKLVLNNVGYVPVYPFMTGIKNPLDVCNGYDELIYVVADNDESNINDNEVLVYDQTGALSFRITIPGATDFTQDRRLHSFIAGRYYPDPNQPTTTLAAVYHLMNLGSGKPIFKDTIKHFECDLSRNNTAFRGPDDVAVQFTGLATLYDNTLYVARTGPRNDVNGVARPDNGVLVFDQNGLNIGYSGGLNPIESSIKSSVGISGIATWAGPPQRVSGISTSKDFFLTLGSQATNLEFRTLAIQVVDDPDLGTVYKENSSFLNFDPSKASRFMYESFRFKNPTDVYAAPTDNNYIFVTDSGTDSLYVFTNVGFEGVNPPANGSFKKQIIVSFGGSGNDGKASGPYNFVDPSAVSYYNRTILVADKGNGRVCRYKLNSDLQ